MRARRDRFGPADPQRPRDAPSSDPLLSATLSPFSTGALDVRLTTLFATTPRSDPTSARSSSSIPAGLTFAEGPDGRHDADLTMQLLAVGDNGRIVGQSRCRALSLRLDDAAYALLRQRGLLYSARIAHQGARPATRSARQCRTIARKAIGTSTQFVDVPAVGKGHLALSGVVLEDAPARAAPACRCESRHRRPCHGCDRRRCAR